MYVDAAACVQRSDVGKNEESYYPKNHFQHCSVPVLGQGESREQGSVLAADTFDFTSVNDDILS